jgi:peptidoglycan/xylan/chitin deacetylase (PgdA/CDA1 family)
LSGIARMGKLLGRAPGRHQFASLLGSNGLRVVLYHSVLAEPGPCLEGLGVNVTPEVWNAHIEYYAREYSIVDLETVLHRRLPKRALLITFDDGYRSLVDVVAPELKRLGLPAVLFAVSDLLGGRRLMLDNVLCYLANTVGLARLETAITGRAPSRSALAVLLEEVVAPLPYRERLALAGRLVEEFGVDEVGLLDRHRLYLGPADIGALVDQGFEIGCHTASHVHCRVLGAEDASREIVDAARTLTKLAGRPVRAFSYPYGSALDATPVAEEALRVSGQEIAFLVEARANRRLNQGRNCYRVAMDWPGPESPFVRLEILPRLSAIRRRQAV